MQRVVIDKRYKVLKKCGTGATGTVYKVRDLKDKKPIALKILSPKKISSEAVQRFKREFELLTGLRHPNLCSVYDFGTLKDGRSYFTMEYVDGPNIFEFTKKLPHEKIYPVRKNVSNEVHPLVVQLCRVLEYIHSKGLIHYDIKPGNVLISNGTEQRAKDNKKVYAQSPMPQAKLMDFGLAGEERIKGGAIIKGTFPYIAPEVIKGLAVDHRADLYSLGVLLYEMFTRRKFKVTEKESFSTLVRQRIQRGSALPSKIVADMPKRLEQLIVRLLKFEPAARFSRANEVIREINKLNRSKFALETEKTLEGYLLSSRFVGRSKEMESLKSLYERACKGEGKVVLVTGDAGIGKTRLLKEFKIFTQLKRSYCFAGYTHRDKTEPLEPFYDIFSELVNYIGEGFNLSQEKKLRLQLAVLFKIFPDLTDGHLKKNLPKLVPLEPQQEKLRNFEALSELIGYSASRLGELIVLLEDVHWVDDLSIQFLEYLGRNIADRNILICATSRRQELKENVMLKKMIHNLKNENRLHQVELGPLNFKSLYSFLDSTITSESNSSGLVRYLMKRTGGNPFFAEEILRTLLQKSGVTIGKRIGIEDFKYLSIPETIEDIVLERIKDLDSNSQRVVTFAAVLLKDFDYDLMKRLTGLDDTDLSKVLWALKKRQVLIEKDNRYQFYHATLREAINKRMANREKRKIYYQTGKTLEHIHKRNTEGVVEDLAYYFINAKDSKKGIKYGLKAAKKNKERYANEQAIQFYKGVLGLLGTKDPKRRFNILQELAQIEIHVGFYDDAIKTYSKALNLKIGTVKTKMRIYSKIGYVHESKGEYNKALHIYQRAARLLGKNKSIRLKSLLETFINVRICRTYQMLGDIKSVNKFNFDNLQFLKELKGKDTIKFLSTIYHTMGLIEQHKIKYSKAEFDRVIFYYNKAYECFKKMKDENRIAAVLTNLGLSYCWKLDLQKASDYFRKSNQTAEKTGDHYSILINLCNLGLVILRKGNYSKALQYFKKTLSISKKIGNPLVVSESLWGIGLCYSFFCNYKKAKECYEEIFKISDKYGLREYKISTIENMGNVYQATGNYSMALRFYKKSLKISKDIRGQQKNAGLSVDIGTLFLEIGNISKAKRYVEDALKMAVALESKEQMTRCYIFLSRLNLLMEDYFNALGYYNKGIKLIRKTGFKQPLLMLYILVSEIYYHEKKYLKGFRNATKAVKLAKEMGTKDLYAEALSMKAKNGVKQGILSKIETIKTLDEAKRIAEEIGCPEVLWKIYFAYGRVLQNNKEYLQALKYYRKCNEIFEDVMSKINKESYRKSYLNRPDRKCVATAVDEIERLLD